MLIAVLLVMLLLGLYSLFVFGYSGFWTMLVLGISISGMVLNYIIKKLPRKVINVILLVFVAVGVFSITRLEAAETETSIYDYTHDVVDVEAMIICGDSNGESSLKKLEKKYGTNDTIIGLYAYLEALKGNMNEAYSLIDSCKNKTSIEYYSRMDFLLTIDLSQDDNVRNKKLYNLFIEAVDNQPYWERGLQMAGALLLENKEYDRAAYYLQRAYALDDENPDTLYFLGALYFELGDVNTAIDCFNASIDYGASEEIMSGIAWYVDRMDGEEEKEDE